MIEWTVHPKELDAFAQRLSVVGQSDVIKKLEIFRLPNGGLDVHASAYARAYHVKEAGDREACLRFWTSAPDPTFLTSYAALDREPGICKRALLPRVRLLNKAVVIRDHDVPAVIMDWVNGVSLADFITKYARDPARLYTLAKSLLGLFVIQNGLRVSHGDLRASNILLREEAGRCHVGMIDLDSLRWSGGPAIPRVVGGNRKWDDLRRGCGVTQLQHDYLDQALIYLAVVAVAEKSGRWPGPTDDFLTLDYLRDDADEVLNRLVRQEGVTGRIAKAVREVTAEQRPWPELAAAMASHDPAVAEDVFWSTIFGIGGNAAGKAPRPVKDRRLPEGTSRLLSASERHEANATNRRRLQRTRAPHSPTSISPPFASTESSERRQAWLATLVGVTIILAVIAAIIIYMR